MVRWLNMPENVPDYYSYNEIASIVNREDCIGCYFCTDMRNYCTDNEDIYYLFIRTNDSVELYRGEKFDRFCIDWSNIEPEVFSYDDYEEFRENFEYELPSVEDE